MCTTILDLLLNLTEASNQSTPNAKKNLSQKITTDGKNTASTPIKEKNKSTQDNNYWRNKYYSMIDQATISANIDDSSDIDDFSDVDENNEENEEIQEDPNEQSLGSCLSPKSEINGNLNLHSCCEVDKQVKSLKMKLSSLQDEYYSKLEEVSYSIIIRCVL
jgi:hypothetical protein